MRPKVSFKIVQTDKERSSTKDGSLTLFAVLEREKQNALMLQAKQEQAEKIAREEKERKAREAELAKGRRIQNENENKKKEAIAVAKAKEKRRREIEEVIQKEEAIVKENERTVIKIPEIHFDYSLWYLRRESRERLGKVIEIMKANPGRCLKSVPIPIFGAMPDTTEIYPKNVPMPQKNFWCKTVLTKIELLPKDMAKLNLL